VPQEMRQRAPDDDPVVRHTILLRGGSVVLALAVAAIIAVAPEQAGSHGTLAERASGAMIIVGAIACLIHGLGLRGRRPPVRILTHPGVAWTLTLVGLAASVLV